jgi:cytosine/adenosine deaminase-related metal-dependent hydrolase
MLIINATIITCTNPNQILENQAILTSSGRITKIGSSAELAAEYPHEERLDARHQYVMPGNICAHTHFMALTPEEWRSRRRRPTSRDSIPPLVEPDKALSAEDVYLSAMVCIVDAIKHGLPPWLIIMPA